MKDINYKDVFNKVPCDTFRKGGNYVGRTMFINILYDRSFRCNKQMTYDGEDVRTVMHMAKIFFSLFLLDPDIINEMTNCELIHCYNISFRICRHWSKNPPKHQDERSEEKFRDIKKATHGFKNRLLKLIKSVHIERGIDMNAINGINGIGKRR
jgi:hypothetical protein